MEHAPPILYRIEAGAYCLRPRRNPSTDLLLFRLTQDPIQQFELPFQGSPVDLGGPDLRLIIACFSLFQLLRQHYYLGFDLGRPRSNLTLGFQRSSP